MSPLKGIPLLPTVVVHAEDRRDKRAGGTAVVERLDQELTEDRDVYPLDNDAASISGAIRGVNVHVARVHGDGISHGKVRIGVGKPVPT